MNNIKLLILKNKTKLHYILKLHAILSYCVYNRFVHIDKWTYKEDFLIFK